MGALLGALGGAGLGGPPPPPPPHINMLIHDMGFSAFTYGQSSKIIASVGQIGAAPGTPPITVISESKSLPPPPPLPGLPKL